MLTKLFKYDWKAFWKVPATINLALLLITGVGIISLVSPFWTLDSDIIDALMVVAILFYYISIFAGSMAVSVYIAIRFYKSIYTDEGYLTNTLPVTAHQIILSKTFVGVAWTFITGIVVMVSILSLLLTAVLAYGDASALHDFMYYYREFSDLLLKEMGTSAGTLIFFMIISMITGTFFSLFMIYSSISLGQLFTRHKVAGAVIWYIAEYAVLQIASSLLVNVPLTYLIGSDQLMAGDIFNPVMWGYILVTILLSIGLYFISVYMLKRKLNLD